MHILFNIYALFFGLIFGSFLNVLVSRTHDGESLMTRSHCTKCNTQIVWFDNIPIFSFLLLRGKCRKCGEKISFKYPIIELLVGIVSLFCYYISYDLLSYILLFSICFFILYFSIYDIFYQEIFDKLAIPIAVILLILNIVSNFYPISIYTRIFTINFGLTNILSAIIYSFLVVLIIIFSRGKMGAGDIRFAVIAGLILSPDKLYFGIMSTYVVGSLVGVIVAIIKRRFRGIPLPFIPFMGIGIFLSYILGAEFWKFLYFQRFSDKLNLNMLKLPYSKKSFGLVELIVALAIVVVILTLSTVGINSLRDSFQLNSGTQELFNAISLARVYAENNVTYKDTNGNIKVPDAYMVEIGDYTTTPGNISEIEGVINNVQIKYCNLNPIKKDFEGQTVDGINLTCEIYQNKGIENDLAGVEIIKEEYTNNDKTIYEPCSYILFTVQGNELYISSGPTEGLLKTSPCVVTLKAVNSGVKNRIAVNPVNRTIKKL